MAAVSTTAPHDLRVFLPSSLHNAPMASSVSSSWLLGSMLGVVALIAALAFWDEQREDTTALEDFAHEQVLLARSVSAGLRNRLRTTTRREGLLVAEPELLADLVTDLVSSEHPDALTVLVLGPGESVFHTVDGRMVHADELTMALAQGHSSLRLGRPEAAALGLPARTAMAGFSRVDAGPLGTWGVAVVASAQRVRDREFRARWRLILSVTVAGGLVLAFGGIALRKQRKGLELQQELALAGLREHRDERLERATKAAVMGTLATGIAHEVSTPLGVIAGRAEQLLGRIKNDERATRAVHIILEQVENIHQVIRGFLGLAQGATPSLGRYHPAAIVDEALNLCEHRFAKAHVQLHAHVDDTLPLIACNHRLFVHALVNLLLNACDACVPGCVSGGQVDLTVSERETAVAFIVTDNGVGIKEADAARVTEPFFTTKPVGQGTGIGLAIANEITKIHRGNLTLTPVFPRGTRAVITLPLSPEEGQEGHG